CAQLECVKWCPGTELNRRHEDFQSSALPTELPGHRQAGTAARKDNTASAAAFPYRTRSRTIVARSRSGLAAAPRLAIASSEVSTNSSLSFFAPSTPASLTKVRRCASLPVSLPSCSGV